MKTLQVLWLSRHPLNDEQINSLTDTIGADALEITSNNETFPASSKDAVAVIDKAAQGFDVCAGVFPAHIAARLVTTKLACIVAFPVSVPAFAEDGQQRGFKHSHWEIF